MASELSESVRIQIVILSKEGFSLSQITARLKVFWGGSAWKSKNALQKTESVLFQSTIQADQKWPHHQRIDTSSLVPWEIEKATSPRIQNLLNKGCKDCNQQEYCQTEDCVEVVSADEEQFSEPLLRRGNKAKLMGWAMRYQHRTVYW